MMHFFGAEIQWVGPCQESLISRIPLHIMKVAVAWSGDLGSHPAAQGGGRIGKEVTEESKLENTLTSYSPVRITYAKDVCWVIATMLHVQ